MDKYMYVVTVTQTRVHVPDCIIVMFIFSYNCTRKECFISTIVDMELESHRGNKRLNYFCKGPAALQGTALDMQIGLLFQRICMN